MISHDDLLAIMETRYDYYSARVMTREALAAARLEQKERYDASDLQAFAEALSRVGERVEAVTARLQALAAEASAGGGKKAEASAAAPAAEPANEAAPTQAEGGDAAAATEETPTPPKSGKGRRRKKK